MLDRALVKRLRDSDSDSDQDEKSNDVQPNRSSMDRPTDVLTTDKTSDAQV